MTLAFYYTNGEDLTVLPYRTLNEWCRQHLGEQGWRVSANGRRLFLTVEDDGMALAAALAFWGFLDHG